MTLQADEPPLLPGNDDDGDDDHDDDDDYDHDDDHDDNASNGDGDGDDINKDGGNDAKISSFPTRPESTWILDLLSKVS